jgi:Tol biopolymer transport system component
LKSGDTLGPYRVDELLGKGGMGEVYKGTDTRLGRPVAIKVSAREFSDRFEREAKAISSLNHPNVCTLYDVGPNYLVMEFVEGDTLAHLLKNGPLPLESVLQYGIQIADALSAAHAKQVIHRDLKPANIILTRSGAKVLDFGLAKLGSARFEASGSSEMITRTEAMTESGSIVGTLQYMSPEQAEGKETDERSDIFVFGAVLYEMLTGRRAFDGDTKTAVLAAILKDQPAPIQQFQPMVPRAMDRVVRKCLEKRPADRWHSSHDLKQTLELIDLAGPGGASANSSPSVSSVSGTQAIASLPGRRKWLWPGVAAAGVVAAVGLALWAPWRKAAPAQAVRFEVAPTGQLSFPNQAAMTVSPDGRWMVFPATGEDGQARYYIRALDGVEVRALPGTEGSTNGPAAWSYDSRWVIYVDNLVGSKLKKIDIQGGPPQNIADFPGLLSGASWNAGGVIIAGRGGPILRVSASGGALTGVTSLAAGETAHRWPQFLPDQKHFLYLRISADSAKTGEYIGSIDAKPEQQSAQRLLETDRQAYYAASSGGSGHLLFLRGATLMAQPFDPDKMALSGEPVAIADGVDTFTGSNHGLFSVSDTGTMVYRAGSGTQNLLTWFDQQGKVAGTLGDPGDYVNPAISPDGSRIAAALGPAGKRDIWILDVARGTSTRLTFDPADDDYPAWTPDGKNIAFSSNRGGTGDLYMKPADGSGEEKLLLKTDQKKIELRWTRDGRFLLFTSASPKTKNDVWALPFPAEPKPIPLLQTQFNERVSRVSPDGRWLAYSSDESGTFENYVRPFTPEAPGTGAKWLVSKGGGIRPLWRTDGKELFYATLDGQVMAVEIDASKGFQAGTPRPLFRGPGVVGTDWDLAPDGKRFLYSAPPSAGKVIPFTVVLNWAAALKE